MGFSIWLYWRRKKRKGLSNYAGKDKNSLLNKNTAITLLVDEIKNGMGECYVFDQSAAKEQAYEELQVHCFVFTFHHSYPNLIFI